MQKTKKILVLTDHMPWGHRAIAKAIYNYLKGKEKEGKYKVEYAEVKAETGLAEDIYRFSYSIFPSTNRIAHKLFEKPLLREIVEEASVTNLPRLKKLIKRMKPDLIISCYFYHSQSLVKWKEKEKVGYDLWTVVADPWTINPISIMEGADKHLVYDEKSAEVVLEYGGKKESIVKCGWWVREEMYKKHDKEKARLKLGIKDSKRPVVFVGGGSLGTASLGKVLPALLLVDRPVTMIFNTGKDKLGFSMVEEYSKLYRRIKKKGEVEIKNLGWIDNMGEVLSACDIVFGKAGPNFLFDCMAVGKPFVSITHIGGQEDGNIELIKKKKLGWVKEKRGEAGRFLVKYLENPEKYNKMYSSNILKESEKNKDSLERVFQEVKKWQKK